MKDKKLKVKINNSFRLAENFQKNSICSDNNQDLEGISKTQVGKANSSFLFTKSGPNIDKNSIWLSDPALFYENYTKLYFDPKHEKTGLNGGGKSYSALFFSKKVSFLANIRCCHNFLA